MPAVRTYITGLDDALKCFDRAPDNLLRVVKTALKAGGKEAAKEIRKAMPRRFKRLVACKVVKGSLSGDWSALVGAFNRAKSGTSEPDDWFKAYWKNYGTITKRDPNHHFDSPVKRGTKSRRNNVGQPNENFFEAAIAGWDVPFMEAFEKSMAEQQEKLYDR